MPNWCDNRMTLGNEDVTKLDALEQELQKWNNNEFKDGAQPFTHLRPPPADVGDDWYGWNCNNWGTKWDASIIDWERTGDNEITIYCDTAWSPPVALYEYLTEEGWTVDAIYHESGMGFAGMYTSDGGDDCYEYDLSDESSIEALPEDIKDFGGLETAHQDWILNEMEENWRDAERTEWIPASTPPVREGWYEVKTAGWEYPQFCMYDELLEWQNYNSVTFWRGLAEDPNEAEVG